jgi:DamX protein
MDNEEGHLFFTPERRKLLADLLHLMATSRKAILLRGPNRAGKSFFLRQVQQQLENNWFFYKVDKADIAAGKDPIQLWSAEVNANEGEKHSLESHLTLWSRTDRTALLIVEDAHLVSLHTLTYLMLMVEKFNCLRVIFTSTDNLDASIEAACSLINLESFSQTQTTDYVQAHFPTEENDVLLTAGLDEEELFLETGGLPGRINDTLRERLPDMSKIEKGAAPIENRPQNNKNHLKTKRFQYGWLAALGAALIIAYMFWPAQVEETKLFEEVSKDVIVLPINLSEDSEELEITGLPEPHIVEAEQEESSDKKTSNVLAAIDEVVALPADKPIVKTKEQEKPLVIDIVEKRLDVILPLSVELPEIKQKAETSASTVLSIGQHHTWLGSRRPNAYTLQLFALGTEEAAQRYLSQNKMADLHIVRSQQNSKALFIILQGEFSNKDDAEKAGQAIRETLKIKPWPRQFRAIQAEMHVF